MIQWLDVELWETVRMGKFAFFTQEIKIYMNKNVTEQRREESQGIGNKTCTDL